MRIQRVVLLLGDLVALAAFAVLGRRTHEEAIGLSALLDVAQTAAPFVVAWVVAAPLVGALSVERTRALPLLQRTVVAWVCAFPLAAVLRALQLGRLSPWTFYVIAFLAALAFLLAWRLLFWLVGRLAAQPAPGAQ